MLDHPGIEAVSFVGSTAIAETVYRGGTAHGKRVQALGGAKNHLVVMPDADLDDAVDALMGSAYGSAGERCMAVSVAVAVGGVADRLVEKLEPRVRALKIGPGTDPEAEMGPLVTGEHRDKVSGYVGIGRARRVPSWWSTAAGCRCRATRRASSPAARCSTMYGPTCGSTSEEIFGPVLSVVRTPDLGGAVGMINATPTATAWRSSPPTAARRRISPSASRSAWWAINVPIPVPMAFHSFGGWKQSLFGDHHVHGAEGVRFYTRYKAITQRWPAARARGRSS